MDIYDKPPLGVYLRHYSKPSLDECLDCLNLLTDGTEVDIKGYLSSEDAAFAMKVKESMERS